MLLKKNDPKAKVINRNKFKLQIVKNVKPASEISETVYWKGNEDFARKVRKTFVAVNRIISNVTDGEKRKNMYNFFNNTKVDGKFFWEAYLESLGDHKMNQVILDHQRAKEKQGGSGFVSCTSTKHPIFGSTGQDFFQGRKEDKINAVAKIDLAKIDSATVYSTYSKNAMRALFDKIEPEYDQDKNPMDYQNEVDKNKNAAARDSMRTREIVISGPIPKTAIVEIYYNNVGDEGTYEEYGQDESERKLWPAK